MRKKCLGFTFCLLLPILTCGAFFAGQKVRSLDEMGFTSSSYVQELLKSPHFVNGDELLRDIGSESRDGAYAAGYLQGVFDSCNGILFKIPENTMAIDLRDLIVKYLNNTEPRDRKGVSGALHIMLALLEAGYKSRF